VCCQEVEVDRILRLMMVLQTPYLTLTNLYQPSHDGILRGQQLFEAH
jgi:hypothetical protein